VSLPKTILPCTQFLAFGGVPKWAAPPVDFPSGVFGCFPPPPSWEFDSAPVSSTHAFSCFLSDQTAARELLLQNLLNVLFARAPYFAFDFGEDRRSNPSKFSALSPFHTLLLFCAPGLFLFKPLVGFLWLPRFLPHCQFFSGAGLCGYPHASQLCAEARVFFFLHGLEPQLKCLLLFTPPLQTIGLSPVPLFPDGKIPCLVYFLLSPLGPLSQKTTKVTPSSEVF